MARQLWSAEGGLVFGLLVLSAAGCANQSAPGRNEPQGENKQTIPVSDEATAEEAINTLGGSAYWDAGRPDRPIIEVEFPPFSQNLVGRGPSNQITDARLSILKPLKELKTLRLTGTQVTDAGLKELRE